MTLSTLPSDTPASAASLKSVRRVAAPLVRSTRTSVGGSEKLCRSATAAGLAPPRSATASEPKLGVVVTARGLPGAAMSKRQMRLTAASSMALKTAFESGRQTSTPAERSKFPDRSRIAPVARSTSIRRARSA